ncbi:RnfABCDGE type electron transport complex subunit B [Pseudomonas sp. KNUC1026]|uniref:RnfABCDGE type electron transport complex subunit B n=1 Tax=Pseudomonas sp. KNUC1026 TaxID=2893890 RepID=UPI001F244905|nr:RnfABCDGE type electron transport complex subunit B [Pseudomonas sp. KNUC1026]UFH48387.1 RnfABCDGE type electron transport complex subunit B [Pseudomonas sp. KNUC1026]
MTLIQHIDARLPQTQCGKCGHAGCRPYAQGIAGGEPINRCPPGGEETIASLAQLLQLPVIALAPERGKAPAQVAYIREAECIGCTKCIQVCPVDAIVGAPKLMHTVLSDECTGCDLCLAPCPVDCIDLLPLHGDGPTPMVGGSADTPEQWQARESRRQRARARFEQRNRRLQREEERKRSERAKRLAGPEPSPAASSPLAGTSGNEQAIKQAKIAVAMCRAQLVRSQKAFGEAPSPPQQQVLATLAQSLVQAEHELARIQAPAACIPDQKKAKIQLAMAKADLARLETSGTGTPQALAEARLRVEQAGLALSPIAKPQSAP